jgi:hypothetical protein
MLPNPLGNPAIEIFNKSMHMASETMYPPCNKKSIKEKLHKKCKIDPDSIRHAKSIIDSDLKTTSTEVKIPKEDWEKLKSTTQALIEDHDMLNEENQEYRKALSMYRS